MPTARTRPNTKQHLAANRRFHSIERPHHGHCRALEQDIKPRRPHMPQHATPRLPKRADELQSKAHEFPVNTATPTAYGLKIEHKPKLKRRPPDCMSRQKNRTVLIRSNTSQPTDASIQSERPYHGHCRALERHFKPRQPLMPQQAIPQVAQECEFVFKTEPTSTHQPKTHR